MRLGIIQFAPKLNDIQQNISTIEKMLKKSPPADLWVLPELASTGYAFHSRDEAILSSEKMSDSLWIRFLIRKAETLDCWFVCGMNEREGDLLYNSSVLVNREGVAGVYRKLHLFRKEKEFFEPGNLGLPVYETPWGKIGMLICFDWMFPEVWRLMALKNVQVICHPSNLVLPFCQKALPGYALTNRIFIATANRTGKERELTFTGRSMLVSPEGEVLLKGKKKKNHVLMAEIDPSRAMDKQITPENHSLNDRRKDVYKVNII